MRFDLEKIKKMYLSFRREFLRKYVEWGRSDHIVCRTSTIAEELLGSATQREKAAVRRMLKELPFGAKEYEYLSDCKIVEISFESGVHGSNILSPYLRRAKKIYLASPFLSEKDIVHIYRLAIGMISQRRLPPDFEYKVITNRPVCSIVGKVRVLDIHAKFLVTDSVAILGSMNFNSAGLSRAVTHELLFITKDKRFVRDLTERFLWWWDLAGEIEEVREEYDFRNL